MSIPTFQDWIGVVDVLNRYAESMDSRNWALLDEVFTPDATGTYRGQSYYGLPNIITFIRGNLGGCGPSQHLLGNYQVKLEGDTANSVCRVRVFHVGAGERAKLEPWETWGEYRHRLVRTPQGWRIKELALIPSFSRGDRSVLQPG